MKQQNTRRTIAFAIASSIVALLLLDRISLGRSSQNQNEKATPIKVGEMSEKEKVHSSLWAHYHTGRRLDAPPSRNHRGEIEQGVYIEPGTPVINPYAPSVSFEAFIANLNCESDAVVIVIVQDKVSQLTGNREFIFTDYNAEVEAIYKNNRSSSIQQRSIINISRPGGRVEINGKTVSAFDSAFKSLQIKKRYLLFLTFVSQTGAYQSIKQGTFLIGPGALVAMTEESLPGGPGHSRVLTSSVRNALHTNCNKQ